jgi:hypothetical protein
VSVLQVLLFRSRLQVFLQTVAAVGSGDGRDVDAGGEGGSAVSHGFGIGFGGGVVVVRVSMGWFLGVCFFRVWSVVSSRYDKVKSS